MYTYIIYKSYICIFFSEFQLESSDREFRRANNQHKDNAWRTCENRIDSHERKNIQQSANW